MRKALQIAILTAGWLLASPTLHVRDAGWPEVGAPPALAEAAQQPQAMTPPKIMRERAVRRKPARRSSAPIPPSVAPGFHPMQPITTPEIPRVSGVVTAAPPVPGYPRVPTVPIIPRGPTAGAGLETVGDRIARCTHQGALGGLPAGKRGAYIHACAMQ